MTTEETKAHIRRSLSKALKGKDKKEIARLTGISLPTLNAWVQGRIPRDKQKLYKLFSLLAIPDNGIFGDYKVVEDDSYCSRDRAVILLEEEPARLDEAVKRGIIHIEHGRFLIFEIKSLKKLMRDQNCSILDVRIPSEDEKFESKIDAIFNRICRARGVSL